MRTLKRPSLTLLVVTKNEVVGLKHVMPRISPDWYERLVILDGGSTDGSAEWAIENGYEVFRQKSPGVRGAYKDFWPKISTEFVITFSPDNNSLPEAIPIIISELERGNDMVIASRYLPPAVSEDDDFLTRIGNWCLTRAVNLLHGGSFTDVLVIFRGYRVAVPVKLQLFSDTSYKWFEDFLHCPGFGWEFLSSVRAAKHRLQISEIPATEHRRLGGERKLRVFRWGMICAYLLVSELWFNLSTKPKSRHN